MKKIFFFLFFVYIIISSIFANFLNYTNDSQITIDDCIKLSILNSRKLKISDEDLILLKYKTKELLSYKFPKIDFIINYGKFNTTYDVIFGNYGNILMLDHNDNQIFSNRLLFNQVLYKGNFAKNIKNLFTSQTKKIKTEYEIIKKDIIFNIKNLFQEYFFLSEKISFYEKYYKYLEKFKKYYLNDKKLDFYKKNEFENYLINIEQLLDTLKIDKDIKKLEIFKQTGIDLNSDLKIIGIFAPIDYQEKDLDIYISKALITNPKLTLSEAEEKLGFIELKISNNEKNPFVSINGIYDYYSSTYKDNFFTSQHNNWFIGLSFNLPIIDGGIVLSKNNQKQSNIRKLKLNRIETEEYIKLEIIKSFKNYKICKNILENNKKFYLKQKNDKNFEHISKFFSSNIEGIKYLSNKDFELLKIYKNVFDNYIKSIYDYNKSILILEKNTGDID